MSLSKATVDSLKLTKYGITQAAEIFYNLSYDDLFKHETGSESKGFEKGTVTNLGAVAVDTGDFTGRSPKDKYIVEDSVSKDTVWWSHDGSDNQPMQFDTWEHLKDLAVTRLNNQKLYVMDGFCGASPATRISVRLVTEVAWMAHFFKNMFIRPTESELLDFKPDWTILNACKTSCEDYAKYGMHSKTFGAFNLTERMTLIGNTWYGGEIKKGIFSIMNYFLPMQGIGSFHCSANQGEDGDTALFFGLSGTGKTTLSTDPKRALIGDDEHGWDDDGVFNLEGGCYAKTIGLSKEQEPDIFNAIRRDALLENVGIVEGNNINFEDSSKTENTRVSYPIYHIDNIVKPVSKGTHPSKVIFLTCDAYGVLPPVAKLTEQQAMYQYLSGYTAKVAGTELGVTEPQACFSACFGQPFLLVHPTQYAEILGKKIKQHNAKAYLVNTGWTGGKYGVGSRMSIKNTRAIIDAILDGSIEDAEFITDEVFNFSVPTQLHDVDSDLLLARNTWPNKAEYDKTASDLAVMFVENFHKFANTKLGAELAEFGPVTKEKVC